LVKYWLASGLIGATTAAMERETEGQTDRQTDTQIDKYKDSHLSIGPHRLDCDLGEVLAGIGVARGHDGRDGRLHAEVSGRGVGDIRTNEHDLMNE